MRGKPKNIKFIITILSLTVILSACNSNFVEGSPYYYELMEIEAGKAGEDINNRYVIDPFEEEVIAFSPGIDNMEELPYKLEKYEETEENLIVNYENDQSDHFEKKSDSLWKSLETEVEYSVQKIDGEFDYTKIQRP